METRGTDIALIVPVPHGGDRGASELLHRHRYNVAQARALGRRGYRVELFVDAAFDGALPLGDGARLRMISVRRHLPFGAHLVAAASKAGARIIHQFHVLETRTLAYAAAMFGRRPRRVYAEYDGGVVPSSRLRRTVMRAASRRLSGVFFTAEDLGRGFVDGGALHASAPIHAVPEISSLLEPRSDRREARARLCVGEEKLVLVVTRFHADKDPECALETFRRIQRVIPGARLWWAAQKDDLGGDIQRRVEADPALKANVHIEMARPAEAMPDLYAAADVMIHASRREICGTAFVEAMQAGLPVAATDIPAFRALSGGLGLARVGDAVGLAEQALRLLSDPEARSRARRRFDEALSYDAIARRKCEVYRSA